MTQHKLIAREPTEEMIESGLGALLEIDGIYAAFAKDLTTVFQAMFDAAPIIESEAEKIRALEAEIERLRPFEAIVKGAKG